MATYTRIDKKNKFSIKFDTADNLAYKTFILNSRVIIRSVFINVVAI